MWQRKLKEIINILENSNVNEIESDHDGVIAEIKIDDGNPVEYNQVLFTIRPS